MIKEEMCVIILHRLRGARESDGERMQRLLGLSSNPHILSIVLISDQSIKFSTKMIHVQERARACMSLVYTTRRISRRSSSLLHQSQLGIVSSTKVNNAIKVPWWATFKIRARRFRREIPGKSCGIVCYLKAMNKNNTIILSQCHA